MRTLLVCVTTVLFALSCGRANVNKIFTDSTDEERPDVLFGKARDAFDKGLNTDARRYARQALDIDRDNPKVAELLGFIYLGSAGARPISIVKGLISQAATKTESVEISSFLGNILDIFNFKVENLPEIATKQESDISFFKGIDLWYPKSVSEARSSSGLIFNTQKARETVCPFLNQEMYAKEGVTLECDWKSTKAVSNQAHLVYAIAALLEAAIFNSVLTFSDEAFVRETDSADLTQTVIDTNLLKRIKKLNQKKFGVSDIDGFIKAVAQLSTDVNSVYGSSTATAEEKKTEMLAVTLLDLKMVVASLGEIAGVPESMLSGITKGLDFLQGVADGAKDSADKASKESSSFRDKLTKKSGESLNVAVNRFLTDIPVVDEGQVGGVSTEQVAALCGTLTDFSGVTSGLPSSCPE